MLQTHDTHPPPQQLRFEMCTQDEKGFPGGAEINPGQFGSRREGDDYFSISVLRGANNGSVWTEEEEEDG